MNQELQEHLFKKYPIIFGDRDKSPEESGMNFGLQVGDGWYWLIDMICLQLQKYHKSVIAFQVKQKFGELRFYVNGATERQRAIIEFGQMLSLSICEKCGSTDDVLQTNLTGSYIETLCKKCKTLPEK